MGILDFFKNKKKEKTVEKKVKTKHFVVDDDAISTNEIMLVIEPLWYSVSIYDGIQKYEEDLKPFTLAQRHIFAIEWYNSEVQNGGHRQFYLNSTGIVWEDAMNGLKAVGAEKQYDIIKESVKRAGGNPSKTREERIEELRKHKPDFDDLDDKFYEFYQELENAELAYIKNNAKDFYFDGIVTI